MTNRKYTDKEIEDAIKIALEEILPFLERSDEGNKFIKKIKEEFLRDLIWNYTDRFGSYTVGYYSSQFIKEEGDKLIPKQLGTKIQQDHVITMQDIRGKILKEVKENNSDETKIERIKKIKEILMNEKVVTCAISKQEHEKLNGVSKEIKGWNRYKKKGIYECIKKLKNPKKIKND